MILFLPLFFYSLFCSEIMDDQKLSLTIYNDGYGIIKDTRTISLDPLVSYVSVTDVATTIQPETLTFKLLGKPRNINILQQNFENNLVSQQSLLKKYLNKEVTVFTNLDPLKIVSIKGTLLAYNPAFLLRTKTGVQIFDNVNGIILSQLPNGLLLMPSLVWKIFSPYPSHKNSKCEIAYRATGFSWRADYNIIESEDQKTIDLSGWVTIENKSGKKYKDVKLKLIAGEVHTLPKPKIFRMRLAMSKGRGRMMQRQSDGAPLVTQKSFGDYHMYTISNLLSVNQSSIKQIQFIPQVKQIPIRKYYLISIRTGGYPEQDIKVQNIISFNNSQNNKMGIPLPQGNVKILKLDSEDNSIELLDQGSIKHSPKNQIVKLKGGFNSDILVRKQIKSKVMKGRSWNASVVVTIQNRFNKEVYIQLQLQNSFGDNLKLNVLSDQTFQKESVFKTKTEFKLESGQKRRLEWNQDYQVEF